MFWNKEYGGDEGWPFIEEYSYKELIDAILRDAEKDDQEQVAEAGNQLEVWSILAYFHLVLLWWALN